VMAQVPRVHLHDNLNAFAEFLLRRDHAPMSGPGDLH
jgi:hypothetical protein